MHMQEVRAMAKEFGIKTSRKSKLTLVRQVQVAEGNFACYATAIGGVCDQAGCLWRDDCFKAARKMAD